MLLDLRPALLRYLTARRVAVDEAEDILQDLFIQVATVADGTIREPRAYLYRAVDNLLLNRRRAADRRAGREQAWAETQHGPSGVADQRPSAEDSLLAREKLGLITAALAALPERTLLVLRRYRVDGVPQKEIATDLGISLSAVEKHLQKAYVAVVHARARVDAEVPPGRRPAGGARHV